MRTRLLVALVLLGSAAAARAQVWPAPYPMAGDQGGMMPAASPGYAPGMVPGMAPGYAPGYAQGFAPGYAQGYAPGYYANAYAAPQYQNYLAYLQNPYPNMFDQEKAAKLNVPPTYHALRENLWVTADYNMAWIRTARLPIPLVTSGSALDGSPGALNQPGTAVLLGDNPSYGMFSGFNFAAGCFLEPDKRFSVDTKVMALFPNHIRFSASSDATGSPLIARPVFDVVNNSDASFLTSRPGSVVGTTTVDSRAEVYGIEFNMRHHTYGWNKFHLSGLAGVRYLHFSESLNINDQLRPIRNNVLTYQGAFVNAPNSIEDHDSFKGSNDFYGAQIGGEASWEEQWFFANIYAKLALGCTDEYTAINGSSTLITPAGNTVTAGGILAQQTNIGTRRRTVLGIIPEWGINTGVSLTEHMRFTMGYNFLFWTKVARPGDIIDSNINTANVPTSNNFNQAQGPAQPAFTWLDSNLWVHTLSCGLEFHY